MAGAPSPAREARALPGFNPQSGEITAPVCQQHDHAAISPTLRLRVKSVLLSRSIPSSNSVDRKFRVPLAVTQAKSKSRLREAIRRACRENYRAHQLMLDLLPKPKAC